MPPATINGGATLFNTLDLQTAGSALFSSLDEISLVVRQSTQAAPKAAETPVITKRKCVTSLTDDEAAKGHFGTLRRPIIYSMLVKRLHPARHRQEKIEYSRHFRDIPSPVRRSVREPISFSRRSGDENFAAPFRHFATDRRNFFDTSPTRVRKSRRSATKPRSPYG